MGTMTSKRRPGRPARIDRARILRTVRDIDAAGEPVTMQAVAERLGVQRASLYHHVADRDELVAMVAVTRLEESLDDAWMPADDAGWRTWLAAYAHTTRDALLAQTTLIDYTELDTPAGIRQLGQIERVLAAMVRDGFDAPTASRCLNLVAAVVQASVRAEFVRRARGAQPHLASVRRMVDRHGDELPLLREAASAELDSGDPAGFEFDLDVTLDGIAALRGRTR